MTSRDEHQRMPFLVLHSKRLRRTRWLPMLLACLLPTGLQARETINWLLRDLPPSTIFAGPLRGQGAIDQLMPLLTARMPDYDHVLMRVNRARSTQMLKEHPSSCDPTLLWTAERAKTITFSIPIFVLLTSGVIVRRVDIERFTPMVEDGRIDLHRLLATPGFKVGVTAQRSYGTVVDEILHHSPAEALNLHYGSEAVGSMLQMERLGRLQALIGFWPEIRYQARQEGLNPEELIFLPVKGNPSHQYAHIGCSNTPQGRQAIEIINREMRVLRESSLMQFYAQWLDPSERASYLEYAKAYFSNH
jgi:uncharacterized protein (TIGR02285 family)